MFLNKQVRQEITGLQILDRSIKFFEKINFRWREGNTDPVSYFVKCGNKDVPYASCFFLCDPKSPRLSTTIRLDRTGPDENWLVLPKQKDALRRYAAKEFRKLVASDNLEWLRKRTQRKDCGHEICGHYYYEAADKDNGITYSFMYDRYGCPTIYDICFSVDVNLNNPNNRSIETSFNEYLKKRKPVPKRF